MKLILEHRRDVVEFPCVQRRRVENGLQPSKDSVCGSIENCCGSSPRDLIREKGPMFSWLLLWAIAWWIAAVSAGRGSFSLCCWHACLSQVLDRKSLPDFFLRLRIWCNVRRSSPAVVWTQATWIGSCLSLISAGSIASTALHFRCFPPVSMQQPIGWWRVSVGRVGCRRRTRGLQRLVKKQLISHPRCRGWTRVVSGLILAKLRIGGIAAVTVQRFDLWSWLIDFDAGWKRRSRPSHIQRQRTTLEALLGGCRGYTEWSRNLRNFRGIYWQNYLHQK